MPVIVKFDKGLCEIAGSYPLHNLPTERVCFVSAGHSSGDRECIVSLAMGPLAILMADGDKEWLAT